VDNDSGSLVDVASVEPQADKMMDAMKSRERIFFIGIPCHCEPPYFGGEAISL
jgi:hypothetical protein